VNILIAYELKERLAALARKYDRTMAELIRVILRIGLPMMEGIGEAEELMIKEYMDMFRKLRKVRRLKD
jgi:predicted DNA-binding protein